MRQISKLTVFLRVPRTTAVSTLLLALLLTVTGFLLWRDRKGVFDDLLTTQGNLVIGLERDIARTIETYDLSLRAAASGLALLDGTQDEQVKAAILFDGASSAQYFRPILITDQTGRVLHDSAALTPRFPSLAGREYIQQHRDQDSLGLLMQLEMNNFSSGRPFLSLTRRLNGPDGQFAGVVAGAINLDYLQNAFSRFKLPKGCVIALVGYDGHLVAGFPFREGAIGQDVTGGGIVRQAKLVISGSFETTSVLDGVTRLTTVRQLGQLPFFLAIGTPTDLLYAGWRMRAGAAAFCLAAYVGTAYLLLRAFRRELAGRRLAEDAARASEAKIEAYIDNLADGVLIAGRKPDGSFAYERINPAAARMLAVRPEDLVGRHPHEVWPTPVAELIETKWRQALAAEGPVQYQNTYEAAGVRRVLRFNLAPLRSPAAKGAGDVVLLLNSIRDATPLAEMEAQLRQSQRMEAVGQLTAGVAHDFNNLLQVQFGALELLMEEIADRPAALDYAAVALNASRHGSKLTHSLLAFSRQQHLTPKAVPVAKLLDMLGRMLSHTLGPRIALRIRAADGTAPPFADMSQLEAALLNLSLNARDAMPEGGTLTIEACNGEAAHAVPAGLDAASHVLLAVSDEGAGMSAEVKARVCEPFFTTKDVGKGSGLGLSMVHGFVQQSGGIMTIVSAPGKGTRVELWLPKATGAALDAGECPPPERGYGWGRIRVLLVDDAPDVLAITAELLETAGFNVVQATHGEEALLLLETEPAFDILVTDYVMPGIDGGELVRRACATVPGLPAIVLTGFAEKDVLERLPARARIVRKPVTGTDLVRCIAEAARGLEHSAA